jgi:hypothetical protein
VQMATRNWADPVRRFAKNAACTSFVASMIEAWSYKA